MNNDARKRRGAVVAIAATSVVSLVGGVSYLTFGGEAPTRPAALKPRGEHPAITPPSAAPEPPTSETGGFALDFSDTSRRPAAALGNTADYSGFPAAAPAAAGALPALQLPALPELPALPPAEDWLALLQPYVQSYIDGVIQAVGADIAESIVGDAFTNAVGLGLNAAGTLGNLILIIAYLEDDRGPDLLGLLQNVLPAAVAPPLAAEAATPLPDFSGLSTAFAAMASAPDAALGPVALPQLPPLPQLPELPRAEDVAAGIAAALAPAGPLPQLPPLPRAEDVAAGLAVLSQVPPPQLPQLPQLPPGPRAEDVAAGVVGLVAVGFVLSLLAPQPPSLTRMLGLPF